MKEWKATLKEWNLTQNLTPSTFYFIGKKIGVRFIILEVFINTI